MLFVLHCRHQDQNGSRYEEKFRFKNSQVVNLNLQPGDWALMHAKPAFAAVYHYVGVGRLAGVHPDENGWSTAHICDYLEFPVPVPPRRGREAYETPAHGPRRLRDHHLEQMIVRTISEIDFARIVRDGFIQPYENPVETGVTRGPDGLQELETPFLYDGLLFDDRPIVEQLVHRPLRDLANRRICLAVYGPRCALTGNVFEYRLGETKCDASHIWPVHHRGPDSIVNLMMLSPDAHASWDGGLVTLDDNFRILRSPRLRASELPNAVQGSMIWLPESVAQRPSREYIRRHREKIFRST